MLNKDESLIRLPEEFIHVIKKMSYGKTMDEKIRLSLAIALFVEKSVTLKRAAEMADKSTQQFIDILTSKGIPWMEYTEEHLDEDNIAIKRYEEGTL